MNINETKFLKLASLTNRQRDCLEALQGETIKFTSRSILPEVATIITQNTEVVVEKWLKTVGQGTLETEKLIVETLF